MTLLFYVKAAAAQKKGAPAGCAAADMTGPSKSLQKGASHIRPSGEVKAGISISSVFYTVFTVSEL